MNNTPLFARKLEDWTYHQHMDFIKGKWNSAKFSFFLLVQRPINASLEFYEQYNELMNSSDWVLAPLINEVYDAISITDFIRHFNVKRYFTLRSPFSYERTCWLLHCRLIKILNFKCNSERFSIHGCLARIPSIWGKRNGLNQQYMNNRDSRCPSYERTYSVYSIELQELFIGARLNEFIWTLYKSRTNDR